MNNHHTKITRCCAHCGQRFNINPRVGQRHRFCSARECIRISRSVSQRKWLRKNGGKLYFRGVASKNRVREWRKKNPQYWKRNRIDGARFKLSKRFASILRQSALQDSIDAALALKIGVISRITGHALQDEIASEIRSLMVRGNAILRGIIPKKR